MIKHTIEISREPAHLAVQASQLLLKRKDVTIRSFPCEDLGIVLVDHPQTTYTHSALVQLAESDAAVVLCGRDHLPTAIVLPLADHSQVVWRINEQLNVSIPLRKRLWKQLVQAKLKAQASNLLANSPARTRILALIARVRTGDPQNIESQAARIYWSHWLPDETFRRDTEAEGLNSLLNYGYAVVRAGLARAIVAAGYHPSLGLKHKNRSNVFCLADDLIEPLRPLVDERCRELYGQGYDSLSGESKAGILQLLADDVEFNKERGPLMVSLHRYVSAFARCLRGEAKRLEVPRRCK